MKRSLFFLSPALILAACTSLSARLPDISQQSLQDEQAFQETQAFQEMLRLQDRLSGLSAPILKANVDLCEKTAPSIGAMTHTVKLYDKKLRPAARREIGAGDEPSIVYIRPGSPADLAGLKAGDVLLDEDDNPIGATGKMITQILEEGAELRFMRNGEKQTVNIKPEVACDYPVVLKMTSTINAYATGKSIIMTSGMMNFADSDDELAAIIGHELAHNELGHIRKIITNILLSGFATRYTRGFESEADYVGLYFAARAGYTIDGVEQMWRRLGKMNMKYIARDKTHPRFPDRFVRLAAARDEIKAKQDRGEALVPNYKDED